MVYWLTTGVFCKTILLCVEAIDSMCQQKVQESQSYDPFK